MRAKYEWYRRMEGAEAVVGDRLADGDVIQGARRRRRGRRYHDVGGEPVDDAAELGDELRSVEIGEGAVDVIEAADLLHAQVAARASQLLLADRPEGRPGGRRGVADLAGLAPGGRHDHRLGAGFDGGGDRAAGAEDLVVRVGEHPAIRPAGTAEG